MRVHLEGCALSPSLGSPSLTAQLILTAQSRRAEGGVFFRQSSEAREGLRLRLKGGWKCALPYVGAHALHLSCTAPLPPEMPRYLLLASGGASSTRIPLVEQERGLRGARGGGGDEMGRGESGRTAGIGGLLTCTGRLVYGDVAHRLPLYATSLRAWAAVGVRRVFLFARSEEDCSTLRNLSGLVACEVRGTIHPVSDMRSEHLYEQPVRHALCLVYARAAHAAFLALNDVDELPSPLLPKLLTHAATNPRLAGLRFFFDPDGSCPERFCPRNEEDWKLKCPPKPGGVRRNHWKPIVVPSRTHDVDVHQFTPVYPHIRKQVWRACFQHRINRVISHFATASNDRRVLSNEAIDVSSLIV